MKAVVNRCSKITRKSVSIHGKRHTMRTLGPWQEYPVVALQLVKLRPEMLREARHLRFGGWVRRVSRSA